MDKKINIEAINRQLDEIEKLQQAINKLEESNNKIEKDLILDINYINKKIDKME